MATSTVIVYKNGKPASGVRVTIGFTMGQSEARTDANGVATVTHGLQGEATVYLNGQQKGKMRAPGAATFNM